MLCVGRATQSRLRAAAALLLGCRQLDAAAGARGGAQAGGHMACARTGAGAAGGTPRGLPSLGVLRTHPERRARVQAMMAERLMYISELQCTVLEVKVIEGLGHTIDVVLVNGVLREGDTIVLCGLGGAIVTTIRSLLTPHPLKVGAGRRAGRGRHPVLPGAQHGRHALPPNARALRAAPACRAGHHAVLWGLWGALMAALRSRLTPGSTGGVASTLAAPPTRWTWRAASAHRARQLAAQGGKRHQEG